jgi:hypothetical protein
MRPNHLELVARAPRPSAGHLSIGLAFLLFAFAFPSESSAGADSDRGRGVCPPFFLKDEQGQTIDPVHGANEGSPYSPKQTCGAAGCHDYAKITEGYHFTQGKGEHPTEEQAARIGWASSPGNYGGNWCSPGPLYRYLSAKENDDASMIDMTSFTFLTDGCGACHPGGGPAEYDRDGIRYDERMADPASGFEPSGENRFDGDYHGARWSVTGVLEADCLLCHLPGYEYARRVKAIEAHNLRWAATAGSALAEVSGSTKDGEAVRVAYDRTRFRSDGTVDLRMVRSPRNEACLGCHAQPGWKKRGANYRARTDVHLRAGMRCVDCHPAGSSATDPRISGREVHQIAKGDDPGGLVRDDLDNTVIDCADCHDTGRLGAPIPKHRGLPPLHLTKISCQACHIPERTVMPISVQASDVYNPSPYISGGKKLWTFYGPDGEFRNHYGYLDMMGYDDKPTEIFRPALARYKGTIFPVNRVHTAWPGIEIEGRSALQQPRMRDIMKMWTSHRADPNKYPALARITDDNGDGMIEVNRADEIDALIESVTSLLDEIRYPMQGKRVVWVMNDRVYASGSEFRTIAKRDWEASPYGNVHKYSHDVYPARAALGSHGCTDCHSPSSEMFFASVAGEPFDANGKPVLIAQHELLGISRTEAILGAAREAILKPFLYLLLFLAALLAAARVIAQSAAVVLWGGLSPRAAGRAPLLLSLALLAGLAPLLLRQELRGYALPSRAWLDGNHFLLAAAILFFGVLGLLSAGGRFLPPEARGPRSLLRAVRSLLVLSLTAAIASGIAMQMNAGGFSEIAKHAYLIFDLSLLFVLLGLIARLASPAPLVLGIAGTGSGDRSAMSRAMTSSDFGGGR